MGDSDAPGVRGEPGGHRASGRGRDSPDAHFFFADVVCSSSAGHLRENSFLPPCGILSPGTDCSVL